MTLLEQIIIEEFESSHLDFKTIQYRKEKFDDFLVDIMAMANANTKKSKYIVIGVKSFTNGLKEFLGIHEQFTDEATYQQLLHENIEPEIKLDYFPITMNDVLLGVFHISDCDDTPYMLKKDYGRLKRGDTFIRKGSHQTRVTRKDIDDFYKATTEKNNKIEDIQIICQIGGKATKEIKPLQNLIFPSDKAADKIRRILQEKEEKLANFPGRRLLLDIDVAQIGGNSYEQRSTKTLKENLKNVKKTFREDDHYYLFEKEAYKINFELLNTGKVYLEDASIEIEVRKSEGLTVVTEITKKPDNRNWLDKMNMPVLPVSVDNMVYPEVTETGNSFKIFENLGHLKHLIASFAFKTPLRLVLTKNYSPDLLTFKVKIFGKSLEKPIEKLVELVVIK